MKKILIFGTIPPPIGGVTIHLERFLHLTQKYKESIDVKLYDIKKRKLITQQKEDNTLLSSFLSADIVHIHIANSIKVIIALISKLFKKKVIYTHHNSRIKNHLAFRLINWLSDIVILVNDKEIDTSNLNRDKIKHIPAFIPPYKFEELPKDLSIKVEQSDFIISSNSSQYILIDGKDLYGFDLIIEAYAKLIEKKELKNSLLVLVDPTNTTRELIKEYQQKYPWLNQENLIHITQALDFSRLIKKSDLTIRATRSDGDSISIRESLYFQTPIIASDVTYRPEGTTLFKNNDAVDLEEKILDIYLNRESLKSKKAKEFGYDIISLYLKT